MKRKVLFFDFDGVIAETLNMGFGINKEMMPDIEYEEWAGWFMGNIYQTMRKEHANDKSHDFFHAQYCERIDIVR